MSLKYEYEVSSRNLDIRYRDSYIVGNLHRLENY